MKHPAAIQKLIEFLSRLPTVGPKTAERYAFFLLKQSDEDLQKMAQAIAELKEKTVICQHCFSYAEKNPCSICSDMKRDKKTVCVVAGSRDLAVVESSKEFNGLYHVLGGVINPIEGINPDNLNIKQLEIKIKNEGVKEVVLALSPNMSGETTSLYLAKIIKPYKIKVTRLARGLPSGADIEYADEITITNALKYRKEI